MELAAEIFAELSEGAHFEVETVLAQRRQSPRVRISIDAILVRLKPGRSTAPAPVKVHDLSAYGVGLEFAEPIHVEEPFAIRFLRRDGTPLWIQCVAARWQPISDKLFSIGAKFTRILAPPKPAGGPPENVPAATKTAAA